MEAYLAPICFVKIDPADRVRFESMVKDLRKADLWQSAWR
jgi:hypothetical protein